MLLQIPTTNIDGKQVNGSIRLGNTFTVEDTGSVFARDIFYYNQAQMAENFDCALQVWDTTTTAKTKYEPGKSTSSSGMSLTNYGLVYYNSNPKEELSKIRLYIWNHDSTINNNPEEISAQDNIYYSSYAPEKILRKCIKESWADLADTMTSDDNITFTRLSESSSVSPGIHYLYYIYKVGTTKNTTKIYAAPVLRLMPKVPGTGLFARLTAIELMLSEYKIVPLEMMALINSACDSANSNAVLSASNFKYRYAEKVDTGYVNATIAGNISGGESYAGTVLEGATIVESTDITGNTHTTIDIPTTPPKVIIGNLNIAVKP